MVSVELLVGHMKCREVVHCKRGKRKGISKMKKVLELMNCSVGVKQSDRGSNYNQLEFRQRTTQFWMMDRSILCMNVGYRNNYMYYCRRQLCTVNVAFVNYKIYL